MTIPNLVTCLRIVLVPVFGYLWWRGLHGWALLVFAVASLSDWLDGFLARLLDQKSKLGQLLDPAADKLLALVCFLVAAALHAVPRWLAWLVIGRDVILSAGAGLLVLVLRHRSSPHHWYRPSPHHWKPTRLGKYSTFAQVLTIGAALAESMTGRAGLRSWVEAFSVMCAVLTATSGIQYVAFGLGSLVSGTLGNRRQAAEEGAEAK